MVVLMERLRVGWWADVKAELWVRETAAKAVVNSAVLKDMQMADGSVVTMAESRVDSRAA